MRLDFSAFSRMVMVIATGPSLGSRKAADRRRLQYFTAFDLPADAACLLDQIAVANGRLVHSAQARRRIGRRGQVMHPNPRPPEVCIVEIREILGADAIETVRGASWRITPLGRLRTMRARGVWFNKVGIGNQ